MTDKIQIENYTAKSFVVRGETTPYKEVLKQMGGKWNSRLTDKTSGEKFGAWLFWSDKLVEIKEWFSKGCPVPEIEPLSYGDSQRIAKLEQQVSNLTKLVNSLMKLHNKNDNSTLEDDGEDYIEVPRRRLLK